MPAEREAQPYLVTRTTLRWYMRGMHRRYTRPDEAPLPVSFFENFVAANAEYQGWCYADKLERLARTC